MSDEQIIKIKKRGTRQEVLNGTAILTAGGLSRDDLVLNPKTGKICTKKELERGTILSESMRRAYGKPLPPSEVEDADEEPIIASEPTTYPEQAAPTPKKRGRPKKTKVEASVE